MTGAMALERHRALGIAGAVLFAAVGIWACGRSLPLGLGVLLGVPVLILLTAAAVRRPVLAVAAFAVLLPAGGIALPMAMNLVQVLAAFTAMVVLAARISGRGRPIGWSPLLAASVLLVVSAILSSLTSFALSRSLTMCVNYLVGLALAAAVVAATARRSDLLMAAMGLVVGGAGLCGAALTSIPNLKARYHATLVDNRPVGTFAQPNELGLCAAMMLCFSLAMAIVMWRRRRTALSVVCAVASAMALVALVLSLSRGAWIGGIAGLAVLIALLRGARRPLLICLTAVSVTTVVFVLAAPATSGSSVFADRLSSIFTGERSPYDERPAAWAGAVQQMSQSPLLGSGPAAYQAAAAQGVAQLTDVRQVDHAHVLYLTVGAEQGALGVAALVTTIGVGAREALRNRAAVNHSTSGSGDSASAPPEPAYSGVSAAAAAALAAVSAQGVVDYSLRNPVLGTMTWLLIGLLAACARTRSTMPDDVEPEGGRT
ncbi:O-antigen ligase family protein [Streptomyces sp. P17]|uniref:O-antigen ligase family protein n=1 Tax=Streptomyces sp. P17 TaxID=3074716 RepID=UPI0028F42EA6|nr:O-antigen ligase family protein [Streptomyces sp. P17]MDT9694985.1 O-antigen ligase family protein [Streptomyces sp. P17]